MAVFAALADPNRRAILASLAVDGPSTATDLAGRLSMTRQGIAKHLALLAEAGLVTSDAGSGRRVVFRHRTAPIKVAQSYLATLAADWDGSLERLSTYLDDPPVTRQVAVLELPAVVQDVLAGATDEELDGPRTGHRSSAVIVGPATTRRPFVPTSSRTRSPSVMPPASTYAVTKTPTSRHV